MARRWQMPAKTSSKPDRQIRRRALWGAARVWENIGGLEGKGRRRKEGTDNKESSC